MSVVNVQIDERPADELGIVKVLQPEGITDDALEGAANRAAIFAAVDQLTSVNVFGQIRQHVADEDLLATLLRGGDHLVAFGGGKGHRLFDKDVLARL